MGVFEDVFDGFDGINDDVSGDEPWIGFGNWELQSVGLMGWISWLDLCFGFED